MSVYCELFNWQVEQTKAPIYKLVCYGYDYAGKLGQYAFREMETNSKLQKRES